MHYWEAVYIAYYSGNLCKQSAIHSKLLINVICTSLKGNVQFLSCFFVICFSSTEERLTIQAKSKNTYHAYNRLKIHSFLIVVLFQPRFSTERCSCVV